LINDEPEAKDATREMVYALWSVIGTEYWVIQLVLMSCVILFVFCIVFPLIYKAVSNPRLKVFISFHHEKEDTARDLERYFEDETACVLRIPYREGANNQDIQDHATNLISNCGGFVCLPGKHGSYVDYEVFAAKTCKKPCVFLVSELSGTLPNVADKRYAMFRLETTTRERFKPLIEFLSYVGADLRSTWKLCLRALRHPFLYVSLGVACKLIGISLICLWVYCILRVTVAGHDLTMRVAEFSKVEGVVVFASAVVLIVMASTAFVFGSYISLLVGNLVRQFQARRKARLKIITEQFSRDDWVGVIPDLDRGGKMYECLFESAPSAHQEFGVR
jgi:hypothetical protein